VNGWEDTTGIAEAPTFGTYLLNFVILILWFLAGPAFIFTLTPFRLLPDIFLLACVVY